MVSAFGERAVEWSPAAPTHGDRSAELDWLRAVEQALTESQGGSAPLAQRLRSCARVSASVDDFFRFRSPVGEPGERADAEPAPDTPDDVRARLDHLAETLDDLFVSRLGPELAEAGVHLIGWYELDHEEQTHLAAWFESRIFPVLTPLAVDPGHPFPYISDLSLNLAVVLEDAQQRRSHFARLKVPGSLDRFVALPGGERFVPLEQVIVAHLDRLFPGMTVAERHPFRVTRAVGHADPVGQRTGSGRVVRLEVHPTMPAHVCDVLQRELGLDEDAVYRRIAPLDLRWLALIADRLDPPTPPDTPASRRWLWPVAAALLVLVVALLVTAFG